jgi:hypothetical protein
MGSGMSFFSSASPPGAKYDGDPPDRTALWFAVASLAFLIAGGSFALPHMFGRGEQASIKVQSVAISVASGTSTHPLPNEAAVEPPVAPSGAKSADPPPSVPTGGAEDRPASVAAEPQFGLQTAESNESPVTAAPVAESIASPRAQSSEAPVTQPGGSRPHDDAAPLTPQDAGPSITMLGFAPAQSSAGGAERPDDASLSDASAEGSPAPAPVTTEDDAAAAGARAPVGELQPPMTATVPSSEEQQGAPGDASASDAEEPDVAQPESQPPRPGPVLKAHGEPFKITVSASVRARGPDSFQIGNEFYRLSSVEGLGIDKRCEIEPDGRCVFHPRGALKKAIIGATLTCRAIDLDASPKLVECVKTGQQAVPDVTGEVRRVVSSEKPGPAAPARAGTSRAGELF